MTVIPRYSSMLSAGELQPDPAQRQAAEALCVLAHEVVGYRRPDGWFAGLFKNKVRDAPKGLYLHGAVGRGKTMLMDLFFADVKIQAKRRVHFHEFMSDVHDRIAQARKRDEGDPIAPVARDIADETALLCFDELHVTDIADAMILSRLFKVLFAEGIVVVATSNSRPQDLYRNGLNRQLFLPFVDLIEDRMTVLELAAAKDFRLEKLTGQQLYFSPLGDVAHANMRAAFERLTGLQTGAPASVEVKGRKITVPEAAMGVAIFDFADLCEQPLGARDYRHIARAFHTLLIENIPTLTPDRRNSARRFINLIDTLYDNRIGLIASAGAEPDQLYPTGDGADLFARTASRLVEMRSEVYLADRGQRLQDREKASNVEGA
jgi:cell division protein ZapE